MTQGRIWHALQPNWSMLTILVPCSFTPLLWPPCTWLIYVSTLGVFIRPQWTVGYCRVFIFYSSGWSDLPPGYMEWLKNFNVSISNCNTEFLRAIYCKKWFSNRAFYVIIAETEIGCLKSPHTVCNKYLGHMLVEFEHNRIRSKLNKFWVFFLREMVNHFWQSFDAILEDVSVTAIIIWC